MENISRAGYYQKDNAAYKLITREGSKNYEMLYMSGTATAENETIPRGIPADDFNIFTTMVYAMADNRHEFNALHNAGKSIRHIDVGTGPSLYSFIATLPYADELIAIDLAPANIERLTDITHAKAPVASHWYAWLEIAEILHDIGDANSFVRFESHNPKLYDKLRQWPILSNPQKQTAKEAIYDKITIPLFPENPYKGRKLESELPRKLHPRQGDLLHDVNSLDDLVGTADIYTRVFFSESIDDTLEVVAHAETNGIQLAREGAISISGHMTETEVYKGFYTDEELLDNPTKHLKEFPGTSKFFQTMIGKIVDLSDAYNPLWSNLQTSSEERKMVRQDSSYGGAVILYGHVHARTPEGLYKYKTGVDLVSDMQNDVLQAKVILQEGTKDFRHIKKHYIRGEDPLNDLSHDTSFASIIITELKRK